MNAAEITSRTSRERSAPSLGPTALGRRSTTITDRHRSKLALVYVRQSSTQQIFDHQESRERQYALTDYAATLGWPRERIEVIDDDQGRSGRTAEQRPGFQRLLAEVTLDHVGIILGLEISRLSRSSKDWYHLLELCAVFGTLLADQDGVYDPNDANDRLLLGLKGTMSEVELSTMRNRLSQQVLRALEPAALDLSLRAQRQINQERERLHRQWPLRLERAAQTAQRAERHYHAVEPENRLVARTLEGRWEDALRAERAGQEEYDRFLQDQPRQLTDDERARIVALASDIPKLWQAPQTTAAEHKEIIRLLLERVVVHVRADKERIGVEIAWRGGLTTTHEIIRSVARYESLECYGQLLERIRELRQEGLTILSIAKRLNEEGYRTPRSRKGYTSTSVRKLLSRCRRKAKMSKESRPRPK